METQNPNLLQENLHPGQLHRRFATIHQEFILGAGIDLRQRLVSGRP